MFEARFEWHFNCFVAYPARLARRRERTKGWVEGEGGAGAGEEAAMRNAGRNLFP